MVSAIVRIVNNTPYTVHFNNTEDKQTKTVLPKDTNTEPNDHIPSVYFNSWIPYQSSGKYIEVKLGDSAPVRISDDKRQGTENWVSGLEATDYVLYFKMVKNKDGKMQGGFSIVKDDEKKMGKVGYVLSGVIQAAAPVVVLVLMAIFL